MPDYNVYYCMIKPVSVLEGAGVSGSATDVTPTVPSAEQRRASVLSQFESVLQRLMQSSVPHIPTAGGHNWTVRVRQIPTSPAGVPNYTGLSIHIREPIVYLISSDVDNCSSSVPAVRQRPALRMIQALADYSRTFSSSLRSTARQEVTSTTSSEQGRFVAFSDYAPVVAEVYSHVVTEATNWIEIMAYLLANVAFHEIAHCKAECANRTVPSSAQSRQWLQALTGSIHNVSGVGICAARIGFDTQPTTADYRLMGEHMLCPIRFYKHNEIISGQFFQNGSSATLQTDAELRAQEQPSEPRPAIDLDSLDI